ncbi:MAG TPA: hypothetical protein VMU42_12335 [Candidatus Sulfotelmatobacter sp.]|nr:hypothetical protein [Candidatus Sulfotelmatobacter sp.]
MPLGNCHLPDRPHADMLAATEGNRMRRTPSPIALPALLLVAACLAACKPATPPAPNAPAPASDEIKKGTALPPPGCEACGGGSGGM